ncbi:TetR/AcrR family transcriptional regulator [Aliiroseovarius sp. YM-037]|uniref:TetR/AcrR family transcriptional regulator n=1 Tax=Aliiroseovarius sp. YM-037 TaxID=3341728 RepID=UPI003A7F7253
MEQLKPEKQSGWRGSADLWVSAAYQALVDGGVDAVRVMPIAKALGLSRTSFYWHFEDRDALLAAIVALWEDKNTGNLIAKTEVAADGINAAMFNLFDCWIDAEKFDSRLDHAIRNWAQNDASVRVRVDAADGRRFAAVKAMFERFGYAPDQATTRAWTVLYTQVGYISMMVSEPVAKRIDRMPAYVEVFTGVAPDAEEIAVFRARHGLPA